MEIFDIQIRCLKAFGFMKNLDKKFLKSLLKVYRIVQLAILLYFFIMFIFFISENYRDVIKIAVSVAASSIDIITFAKFLTFSFYSERFYKLMDKIEEAANGSKIIIEANKNGRTFSKTFLVQLITASAFYCVAPFSLDLFNYLVYKSEWAANMPIKFKSFYDVTKSPAYEITYIGFVIDIYIISFINFIIDSIFLLLCINIGAKFEILRENFQELSKQDFIKQHQEIVGLIEELKILYRPIIFVEFLIVSVVLCGIGFTIVMAQNFMDRMLVIGFGITMLFQLFFYCFSGQYVMDKAANVCIDIYELDIDFCLIIMRSQKRLRIEAPFYHASMEQFTYVLNRTWALISVLKSMME